MTRSPELKAFLARFFPVFIVVFLLSCFALSGVVSLIFATYLRALEGEGTLSHAVTLLVALTVAGTHIALVRGRTWGVRGIVAALLGGMAAVAPCYAYPSFRGSLIAILLFSLVALLVINSRRYREMREVLVDYRRKRQYERQCIDKRGRAQRRGDNG